MQKYELIYWTHCAQNFMNDIDSVDTLNRLRFGKYVKAYFAPLLQHRFTKYGDLELLAKTCCIFEEPFIAVTSYIYSFKIDVSQVF